MNTSTAPDIDSGYYIYTVAVSTTVRKLYKVRGTSEEARSVIDKISEDNLVSQKEHSEYEIIHIENEDYV